MAVDTHNWAVGEVVTAANMNTYVRDNLADLQSNKVVIKSGTYTGDTGTTQAITGVGFTPIFLTVMEYASDGGDCNVVTTSTTMVDNDAAGMAHFLNNDATQSKTNSDMIRSLDADGFTVGDQGAVQGINNDGQTYEYVAFGAE